VWREKIREGTTRRAKFDMKYLKQNCQPNPKAGYCQDMAAGAKPGRPKNMKTFKSPLERGGSKKKGSMNIKLTLIDDEMESGELEEGKWELFERKRVQWRIIDVTCRKCMTTTL
jgi:hypothetical protein